MIVGRMRPRVIVVRCFWRKIRRVLNLLAIGTNHENHMPKKQTSNGKRSQQDGPNKLNPTYTDKSIHAEEMALDKLPRNRTKRIIEVSIIVIRISRSSNADTYILSNSRPCASCMRQIENNTHRGYRISKVYFSNDSGAILCYKLRNIIKDEPFISKLERRRAACKLHAMSRS